MNIRILLFLNQYSLIYKNFVDSWRDYHNNNLIELYDLHGRIVQSKFNNNIFDTESLKRGVYILVLKEKNISFKLVKS